MFDDWYVLALVFALLLCNCLILAWVTVFTVFTLCSGRANKKAAERRQQVVMQQEIAQRERTFAGGVE